MPVTVAIVGQGVKAGAAVGPEDLANCGAIRQIGYATAVALNWTASDALKEARREIRRSLRAPREWTLRAYAVPERATKDRLYIEVRPSLGLGIKGTPAWKYLAPMQMGGMKRAKRSDKALMAKGIMGPGEIAIPSPGGQIAQAGNAARVGGLYTRLISALGADRSGTQNQTSDSRRRSGRRYYVITGRNGVKLIMREDRQSAGPKAELAIVRRPRLRKMLWLQESVRAEMARRYPGHLKAALALALRTSNRGPSLALR